MENKLEDFKSAVTRMDGMKLAYLDYVQTHPDPNDPERKRRADNAARAIDEWWRVLEGR